ncbi:hypothetical protein VitviT2T_004583 [Vitis vinifera]|uniref:Glycosyl transferase 64 domain-containing protein n=2 Tax=Vitis vinifera TaxID=29760 RepID=A0ABY9BR21_VITVI|nr:glycosyltransferase family protein 64 C3 [Vitis vinifera]WJZ85013.1 hypothetical protein VitviT2T_004583 [Vitis vinifera]|eukprot:XP_002280907.1 PREDICTED: glycosyltransferase family protein 64 C3 [Vitis vinifera]
MRTVFAVVFFFVYAHLGTLSLRTLSDDPCDSTKLPDPRKLRSDQITVLMNGYSESRIPLLRSIAATYAASPPVAAVVILWGNPSTPTRTLAELSHNFTIAYTGAAPISLVRQASDSLNARFLPRPFITTRGVIICDDDVEVDPKSIEFAFRVWAANPHRLIGLFARAHDLDLSRREWIYTVHPDKYSIVLTKFMVLKTEYLYKYSCEGGARMMEARKAVDMAQNCEDILMNFVVAEEGNAGPMLVGAEKVRDWGDGRNDEGLGLKEREVGLSSRRGEHRKRRGGCIGDFHRILRRMPLRYGYGKVVNSIAEEGLCMKDGKLVFCDQWP